MPKKDAQNVTPRELETLRLSSLARNAPINSPLMKMEFATGTDALKERLKLTLPLCLEFVKDAQTGGEEILRKQKRQETANHVLQLTVLDVHTLELLRPVMNVEMESLYKMESANGQIFPVV